MSSFLFLRIKSAKSSIIILFAGVRVAGYRVRTIKDVVHWTLIGERDPMLPQMFFPVGNDLLIREGDIVVRRAIILSLIHI